MLSWLTAAAYDPFLRATEEACLQDWRRELLSGLGGRGLELGAGTGLNLPYYGEAVEDLTLSEPDAHMRHRLAARPGRPLAARIVDWDGQDLRVEAGSLDFVVGTLVLCTVPDPATVLAEVRRVLRPGGRFVFLEHGAATDDPRRLAWQRRVEPVWRRLAGGCHLTRDAAAAIQEADLDIVALQRESMRRALPILRPTVRGIAVRR